jgi:Tol biopolymer transport system component
MTRSQDLDRALTAWLSDGSTQRVPAGLIERVAIDTRNRTQRPGWLVAVRRESMGSALQLSGRTRRLTLIVVIALLAAVAIALIAGPQPPKPIQEGLLAFVRAGDVYLSNPDGSDAQVMLHQDGVRFKTVVWSATGNWLAIDGDPGIVLLDVATGSAHFLAGHNAAWSPDGDRLAVIDSTGSPGFELRIVDPTTRVTQAHFPFAAVGGLAWSPNGRWIAATGNCTGPLCTGEGSSSNAVIRIDVATGDVIQLDGRSGHLDAERQVAWSPDSRHIAYIRWGMEKYPSCGDVLTCSTDVIVADADGGNPTRLNAELGEADQPGWSSDGQWVSFRNVYVAAGGVPLGITIEHPDGTDARSIVTMPVRSYAWGPDSQRVTFTAQESATSVATIWEASLDGTAEPLGIAIDEAMGYERTGRGFGRQVLARGKSAPPLPNAPSAGPSATLDVVTPPPAAPADAVAMWPTLSTQSDDGCELRRIATATGKATTIAQLCSPQTASTGAWSPTGSAFATIRDGRLSIVQADGRIDLDVDDLANLESVGWSPDGAWIYLTGIHKYLLRPDGSNLLELPGYPSWSPSGKRLAVSQFDGQLLIGSANGTGLNSIGSFPPPTTWSPDGSRFGFIRNGDFWTVAVDGTDLRNATSLPLGGASSAAWSPDGQWIAVTSSHGLWMVRPDGTDRRWLSFGLGEGIYDVLWSPDSSRVAISVDTTAIASGESTRIYLVPADGTPTILIDRATSPSWSPDARFLVATETIPANGGYDAGSLVLMNADGSGRRSLHTSGLVMTPPVWLR